MKTTVEPNRCAFETKSEQEAQTILAVLLAIHPERIVSMTQAGDLFVVASGQAGILDWVCDLVEKSED